MPCQSYAQYCLFFVAPFDYPASPLVSPCCAHQLKQERLTTPAPPSIHLMPECNQAYSDGGDGRQLQALRWRQAIKISWRSSPRVLPTAESTPEHPRLVLPPVHEFGHRSSSILKGFSKSSNGLRSVVAILRGEGRGWGARSNLNWLVSN